MKTIFQITLLTLVILLTGCQSATPQKNKIATDLNKTEQLKKYLSSQSSISGMETWQNDFAPGLLIKTAHYDIHTTLLDPLMLSKLPSFIESAHKAYTQQLAKPIKTKYKFTVYLFAQRDQWEKFTQQFAGDNANVYLEIKNGAYYLDGAVVAYNIGMNRTFSAIGHEGWHQFSARHFTYRLPSWLDEGIATLFESTNQDNGRYIFTPETNLNRLAGLKLTMQNNRLMPISKLLQLNPAQVMNNSDSVTAFYSQSYALVRFLREYQFGKRMTVFQTLLQDGFKGDWPIDNNMKAIAADRNIPLTASFNKLVSTTLFAHYFTNDSQFIEEEYYQFCKKLAYYIKLKKMPNGSAN